MYRFQNQNTISYFSKFKEITVVTVLVDINLLTKFKVLHPVQRYDWGPKCENVAQIFNGSRDLAMPI